MRPAPGSGVRAGAPAWYMWTVMRLGVRQKLVLLSVAVMIVTSFGFAALSLSLSRGWVEDDLKDRAIAFAREIAATIGDRHEFESGLLLGGAGAADPRDPAEREPARHPRLRQRRRQDRRDESSHPPAAVFPERSRTHQERRGRLPPHRARALLGGDGPDLDRGIGGGRGRVSLLPRAPGSARGADARLGPDADGGLGDRDGLPDEPHDPAGGGSPDPALRGRHRAHPLGRHDGDRPGR